MDKEYYVMVDGEKVKVEPFRLEKEVDYIYKYEVAYISADEEFSDAIEIECNTIQRVTIEKGYEHIIVVDGIKITLPGEVIRVKNMGIVREKG